MLVKRERRWIRRIAIAVAVAIGCSSIGVGGDMRSLQRDNVAEAVGHNGHQNKDIFVDKKVNSATQVKSEFKTEVEYWRYAMDGVLNRPLVLANGLLFLTTENGLISVVDKDGKQHWSKNQYTGLTAPSANKQGDIWIAGNSARLYRYYDSKGNGVMAGMYYFQKKTEGLMPSAVTVDGEGRPYFTYEHAVLSLNASEDKEMYLLPVGVKVISLVPANKGVYALGSDGSLYVIDGSKLFWKVVLVEGLSKVELGSMDEKNVQNEEAEFVETNVKDELGAASLAGESGDSLQQISKQGTQSRDAKQEVTDVKGDSMQLSKLSEESQEAKQEVAKVKDDRVQLSEPGAESQEAKQEEANAKDEKVELDKSLQIAEVQKAKLAADGTGGIVLMAGKTLAAYDADGKVRFVRELAAEPAGGWTSPVVIPGDDGSIIAAELSGNAVVSLRLRDGAERWRKSVSGAGGFGPAALTPDSSSGQILAASRSGAVHAIDGGAGMIAHSFKHAASAAGGVVALGGGRIAYASAKQLVAAGSYRPVAVTYAAAVLKLPIGTRLLLSDKLKLSAPVAVSYRSDNSKIVRISPDSIVTPIAVGKTNLIIDVTTSGYRGQLKLPVEITATTSKLKSTAASKKIKLGSGQSFSIQTVNIPKSMPMTLGVAQRSVGKSQGLSAIAKAYGAEAAINGTFFSAYDGLPEPYGMMMSNGKLDFIGNMGTTIGFTWDGTVLMDSLRAKIIGGTKGSFSHPNNWYAYFVNRTPQKGKATATMFTPARGPKIGFNFGSSVTVRNGIVTRKDKNVNVSIPSDGYVLVFAGAEEKLADRFKEGIKVDYKLETKNMSGKTVGWSRVHTAVGAGPRLVKDGKLAVNGAQEGFTEAEILKGSAARSGIIVEKDGTIIIATVPSATMKQWGEIMLKLGAHQAMNLDGGASSGMYGGGKVITTPGRLISNVLVFGNSLKW
ncbi:phosphodiester glycosidase family protein [Paenibacillus sp. GSMTC-2017]|uniref:phosphodiester glycosidase family protein n=1 Tax=Paenibacillus sp. GSMTC-2017 TaxID=2794350 RepID=UPI0018D99F31|nr:phosphodiester glycosidase family protein [Paenibacillus sp. GSMTC-2017]MBH5320245.1 phosphodiester glycosidase family protein [Paenibacillus sp. GSMTC-2017]